MNVNTEALNTEPLKKNLYKIYDRFTSPKGSILDVSKSSNFSQKSEFFKDPLLVQVGRSESFLPFRDPQPSGHENQPGIKKIVKIQFFFGF